MLNGTEDVLAAGVGPVAKEEDAAGAVITMVHTRHRKRRLERAGGNADVEPQLLHCGLGVESEPRWPRVEFRHRHGSKFKDPEARYRNFDLQQIRGETVHVEYGFSVVAQRTPVLGRAPFLESGDYRCAVTCRESKGLLENEAKLGKLEYEVDNRDQCGARWPPLGEATPPPDCTVGASPDAGKGLGWQAVNVGFGLGPLPVSMGGNTTNYSYLGSGPGTNQSSTSEANAARWGGRY